MIIQQEISGTSAAIYKLMEPQSILLVYKVTNLTMSFCLIWSLGLGRLLSLGLISVSLKTRARARSTSILNLEFDPRQILIERFRQISSSIKHQIVQSTCLNLNLRFRKSKQSADLRSNHRFQKKSHDFIVFGSGLKTTFADDVMHCSLCGSLLVMLMGGYSTGCHGFECWRLK